MNSSTSQNATTGALNETGNGNETQQPGPPDLTDVINRMALFMKIFYPVIVAVGTTGNVLSIVVLLKAKNRKFPTAIYLTALAFSDLILLWIGSLQLFVKAIDSDLHMSAVSEAGCRIHTFLLYVSIQLSSWLLVAVTMERFLCTYYPHKVGQISTRKTAGVVIAVMTMCIILLNGHFLFDVGPSFSYEEQAVNLCYPKSDQYRYFVMFGLPWVDLSVAYLVPFMFITIGNVAIIVKLIRSRAKGRHMSFSKDSTLKAKEEGFRSLMIMLVLLGVLFFFSMSPVSVYYIGRAYWIEQMEMTTENIETVMETQEVVIAVSYLNATWNFYLYCLSGSRFRKDVRALLRCTKGALSQKTMFDVHRRSNLTTSVSTVSMSTSQSQSRDVLSVISNCDMDCETVQPQHEMEGEFENSRL